jgi:hypothetical protein
MKVFLIAGVISGIAGLLVFLTIHHFWIRPIWFIAPAGIVVAGFGGLALGWSFSEIQASLPGRPWTFLSLAALIGVILTPSILFGQMRGPIYNPGANAIPPDQVKNVVLHVIGELLVPAIVLGGLAGWLLGHTARAALATALAGLVFAIGPGHNIPLLASTPAAGKGVVLLVVIVLIASLVFVESVVWLASHGS